MTRVLCSALVAVLLSPACASAQGGARPFRALSSGVMQADAADTREVRLQWSVAPAQPAASGTPRSISTFTVLQQRRSGDRLRRERAPEVSEQQLVVVLQNAAGQELDWRLVANPRVLRAEVPGANGQLTGRVIEQDAELVVAVPDIAGADRLQIYKPVWNGKEFTLEPLALVLIGTGR